MARPNGVEINLLGIRHRRRAHRQIVTLKDAMNTGWSDEYLRPAFPSGWDMPDLFGPIPCRSNSSPFVIRIKSSFLSVDFWNCWIACQPFRVGSGDFRLASMFSWVSFFCRLLQRHLLYDHRQVYTNNLWNSTWVRSRESKLNSHPLRNCSLKFYDG